MKLPVTLGHENVGEVVAVGPRGARASRSATRVLADPWIGCGTCAVCQRGEENLCRAMKSLGVFSQRRLCRLTDACRIRAICSTSAICRRSAPRRSPARASPPTAR